jgi:L-threonylcarbamoyladenylate synthase
VRELCREVGPLATTSANRHKEPTPPDAAGVADALGDAVALVLDGGVCEGAPSTVVSVLDDEVTILREGRITTDQLLGRAR